MIAMPVHCDMPLFATRYRAELSALVPPHRRSELAEAVRSLLPEATVVADEPEAVIVTHPHAEVALREVNGTPTLEITSPDPALAESIHKAIDSALKSLGND
jgi:hypothetical protein